MSVSFGRVSHLELVLGSTTEGEYVKGKRLDVLLWLALYGFNVRAFQMSLKEEPQKYHFEMFDPQFASSPIRVEFYARRGWKEIHRGAGKESTIVMEGTEIQSLKTGQVLNVKNDPHYKLPPGFNPPAKRVLHPFNRYPRNAKCFCGSEKKFKKCHKDTFPMYVLEHDYPRLKKLFDLYEEKFL